MLVLLLWYGCLRLYPSSAEGCVFGGSIRRLKTEREAAGILRPSIERLSVTPSSLWLGPDETEIL